MANKKQEDRAVEILIWRLILAFVGLIVAVIFIREMGIYYLDDYYSQYNRDNCWDYHPFYTTKLICRSDDGYDFIKY